ncbi:MAG: tetratricopeptide repeat protein [Candidatus Sericytochromatia bacterium]|nr:tetratricopeptide repeat protein [Candidatus Sericytochromatia bacterium]
MLPHLLPLAGAFALGALILAFPGRTALTPDQRAEVGIAYMKLKLPGAERALRAALAAAPAQPRAGLALGMWLTRERRYDEAVAVLEQARTAAGPQDLEPALALAVAQQLAGRTDAARALFGTLRERHPADGRAAFNLAMLALKRSDRAEARTRLREALGKAGLNERQRRDAGVTLRRLEAAPGAEAARPEKK